MAFKKIISGTLVISSVGVVRLLVQYLSLPILSRLLSPEEYGLVAIAMPLIFFSMIFSDAGLGLSLVRRSEKETDQWSSAFWVLTILGFGIALLVCLLAPIAGYVFDEPRLVPLLMALSLVIPLQSISTAPGSALQRRQRFKTLAMMELTALIAGVIAALFIAYAGGGAWALVGQQLVFYTVRLSLTLMTSKFVPKRVCRVSLITSDMHFGKHIIGFNLADFFARSLDILIIGKVLGAVAAGFYTMAFQFIRLPGMLIMGPLQSVIFSHMTQRSQNPAAISRMFKLLTSGLATLVIPVIAMVAVASEPLFQLFLSEKWLVSAQLYQLMAVGSVVQVILALGGTMLLVQDLPEVRLRLTLEFTVLWGVFLLFVAWYGLTAIAVSYSVAGILYFPRFAMVLLPRIGLSYGEFYRLFIIPLMTALPCAVAYYPLAASTGDSDLLKIAIAIGLGILALMASILIQRNHFRHHIRQVNADSSLSDTGAAVAGS